MKKPIEEYNIGELDQIAKAMDLKAQRVESGIDESQYTPEEIRACADRARSELNRKLGGFLDFFVGATLTAPSKN